MAIVRADLRALVMIAIVRVAVMVISIVKLVIMGDCDCGELVYVPSVALELKAVDKIASGSFFGSSNATLFILRSQKYTPPFSYPIQAWVSNEDPERNCTDITIPNLSWNWSNVQITYTSIRIEDGSGEILQKSSSPIF